MKDSEPYQDESEEEHRNFLSPTQNVRKTTPVAFSYFNVKIVSLVSFGLIVFLVLLWGKLTAWQYVTYRRTDLRPCYIGGGEGEWGERNVARYWTRRDACVLELGGAAGSVSSIVQFTIDNKKDHVVVQPRESGFYGGLSMLEKNRKTCNSQYQIIDHILRKNEAADLLKLVSKPFDTLIADCEDCLRSEYEKNPELFKHVRQVQVERDDKHHNYDDFFKNTLHMKQVWVGVGCEGRCNTDVWERV